MVFSKKTGESQNNMKSEAKNCIICFTILAVVTVSYFAWYGQKTLESSLTEEE